MRNKIILAILMLLLLTSCAHREPMELDKNCNSIGGDYEEKVFFERIAIIIIGIFILCGISYALNLSRVKTWSASDILTAADLNAEFDNILDHSITNSDISASAAIVGSKLDLSVPGNIGATTPGTGKFSTLTATGSTTLGDGADTLNNKLLIWNYLHSCGDLDVYR